MLGHFRVVSAGMNRTGPVPTPRNTDLRKEMRTGRERLHMWPNSNLNMDSFKALYGGKFRVDNNS